VLLISRPQNEITRTNHEILGITGCDYLLVFAQAKDLRPCQVVQVVVGGYNCSDSKARQRELIEDFSYTGFMDRTDLLGPELIIGYFERCEFRLR
jgi:hypothetical protein